MHSLLLVLCALLLPWAAVRAQMDPAVAKKVAKLSSKLLARQILLDEHQDALAAAQAELLTAQLALTDAESLPEGTPEELVAKTKALKVAHKAIKKWTAKTNALNKKITKDGKVIGFLIEKIEELDPDHFGDSAGDPGGGDPQGGLDPAASNALLAVDCGDLNGYAAPQEGWQLLSQTSAPPGVSLSPAALDTVHVAQFFQLQGKVPFPSSVVTIDPDQLGDSRLFTSLSLANPTTLSIAGLSPATPYRVLLELGALSPWVEYVDGAWTNLPTAAPDIDVDAWLGGAWKASLRDVRCTTGTKAATWETDLGGVVRAWVPATTDGNGTLKLRLSSSSGGAIYLASFAVYENEDLPIIYKHTASGSLQSSQPAAAVFVAAFNGHDLDAAEEAADDMADEWLRGVALCHLVGWLDGTRDGHVDRLDDAIDALVAARDAGHPGAVWLLSDALAFRRALDHIDAAGTDAGLLCPDQGGPGFLNPDCAGQAVAPFGISNLYVNVHIAQRQLTGIIASPSGPPALSDLAAWNAGTLGPNRWQPSPLLPRALKQWGVDFTLINPQLAVSASDPGSVEINQDLKSVFDSFVGLGFASADFPDELELKLFKAYVDSGKAPKDWDPADYAVFTPGQIASSWWGEETSLPQDVAGVPAWANAQRGFLRLYHNAAAYWLQERISNGEFSAGPGDDVELLLQLFPLLQARQDSDDRLLVSGLDDALIHALEGYPTVKPGYYDGWITDVEHTAEFTTDPYIALRGAFGLTARAARTAFYNAHEVLDSADPDSAFAGVNDLGRTRFRSYYFTASGPSDDPALAVDVFLNGRAVSPALNLSGRGTLSAGHPALADLRAWASGVRDDALLSGPKPEGFPAPAQWPSGALGVGSTWYSESGTAGDESLWQSGEVSYVLGLLQSAYRSSTAADRWQFLLPAVRMVRAAKDWEDAGQP
ncbi:MAG TPA: hypothetical protein VFY71_17875, partial [Planctomycetota bacterium]|nr:hypothetical protein [Planctomycetota bacterium]